MEEKVQMKIGNNNNNNNNALGVLATRNGKACQDSSNLLTTNWPRLIRKPQKHALITESCVTTGSLPIDRTTRQKHPFVFFIPCSNCILYQGTNRNWNIWTSLISRSVMSTTAITCLYAFIYLYSISVKSPASAAVYDCFFELRNMAAIQVFE